MIRRLLPVVFRATGPTIMTGTLAAHVAVAFVVTQLDAMVDWHGVQGLIREAPAWFPGAAMALVSIAWGAVISGAVRAALGEIRFLAALPLTPTGRALVVLPAVCQAVGWPIAAAWLLPSSLWMVAAGLWSAAAAVLFATRRPWGLALALVAVLGPWAALLSFPLIVPVLGRALDRPLLAGRPLGWRIRPIGPVSALVWRDMLLLTRRFPVALGASFAWAAPAWAVQRGLSVNPEGSGPFLLVTLGVAALIAAASLGRVALALGAQLDPPTWPVSPPERAVAFALSGLVLLIPTLVVLPRSVALVGPVYAAGIALALTRHEGLGVYLWFMIGVCVLGSLPYAPLTLGALAAAAMALAAWRIEARRRC